MKILKLKKYHLLLFLVIGLHLYLLTRLIFFPYPEQFLYSYLTQKGLIPYKQIFDQHFPGLMFFPINFATLGMNSPVEARIWQLLIVAISQFLLFSVTRKLFKSYRLALLTNILYLFWQPFFEGYVLWIDSFMPLFLLSAFYFLINKKFKYGLFYCGLMLGISIVFKQVTIPLVGLVYLYLLWINKNIRKTFSFVLGIAIPLIFLIFYITKLSVWRDFIYWTFTFNLTTFAKMGRKYPGFGDIIRVGPLFGLAGLLTLVGLVKKRNREIILLAIFYFTSLLFAYARFDFVHLQPSLIFAVILVIYFFRTVSKKYKLFLATFYILLSLYFLTPFYKTNISNRVLFFGNFEDILSSEVLRYAKSGDSVFIMGTTPHIYQITGTIPSGRVFSFQFPWFMIVGEKAIYNGIISDPPKVVIRDKNASVQGMVLVDFMPDINRYVERYYKVVDEVEGTEIMIPN